MEGVKPKPTGISESLDQRPVQVTKNVGTIHHNADVIPGVHRNGRLRNLRERGFGAAHHLFDAVQGIVPAADVPPRPIIVVEKIEHDEKTFIAADLARLQTDGVIRPIGVAICGITIGGDGGLLIQSIVRAPGAVKNAPAIRALAGKITLVKRHAVACHDDVGVLNGSIPRTDTHRTVQRRIGRIGRDDNGVGQNRVTAILTEQFLDVIRRRAKKSTRTVVINHVRQPLDAVHVCKQRRVRSHFDHIRISLHARHERRFAQRGREIAVGAITGRDGVFADKNLRAAAAVAVVFCRVGDERAGAGIIMFVPDFHRPARWNAAPIGRNQMDGRDSSI